MAKHYKRGDIVTFRLTKKQKYSDDIIDLINNADKNTCIIKALEFYCKYQHLEPFMKVIANNLINETIAAKNNKEDSEEKTRDIEYKSKNANGTIKNVENETFNSAIETNNAATVKTTKVRKLMRSIRRT